MDNKKIEIRKTEKYGNGIFALKDIKKDEILFEFEGDILSLENVNWTDDMHDHAVQIGENAWISNTGIGRSINHSCEPNCGIKNLIQVVSLRNIKKDDELTYDYEMTENSKWMMKCDCRSKRCRKIIGRHENMPEEIKQKYKGYISEWLVKKFNYES